MSKVENHQEPKKSASLPLKIPNMVNDQQNHGQNGRTHHELAVVMVPFPGQGHLNQLLHLSRLISAYDIPVHFVATTTNTRQAKLRVQGWDPTSDLNIIFHEIPPPPFQSLPPNPNSNANIQFPSHLQPAFDALAVHLRGPIANLLSTLSLTTKRIVIIHDALISSAVQDFVSLNNAEAYTFHALSAFFIFCYSWVTAGKPFALDHKCLEDLPSLDDTFTPEFTKFITSQIDCIKSSSGVIMDVSQLVEGPYIDLLARKEIGGGAPQWAIGPFNPLEVATDKNSKQRHKCLEWLDKQAKNSVIYVSFGTSSSFTDEQIQEMAIGLEESEQKFIWVVRDGDKGDVFDGEVRKIELPKGFEDRVEGRGMVVRDWAPQLEILGHTSTGGFMSHCGWNSTMESITMGVPIATWPIHSDQPFNTIVVTKVLKTGTVARDWTHRDKLVTSTTIEKVVRKLMASIEGEEMRKRAVELGGAVRSSMAEGGIARMELDSFISHICR